MKDVKRLEYKISAQLEIIKGLYRALEVLRTEADKEMEHTLLSTHSPHYDKAISALTTRLKLAKAKVDLLTKALEK